MNNGFGWVWGGKNERIFDGHARGLSLRNFFSCCARKKRFLSDTRLFLYIKNERVLALFYKNNSQSNELFCFYIKYSKNSLIFDIKYWGGTDKFFFRAQHEKKFVRDRTPVKPNQKFACSFTKKALNNFSRSSIKTFEDDVRIKIFND